MKSAAVSAIIVGVPGEDCVSDILTYRFGQTTTHYLFGSLFDTTYSSVMIFTVPTKEEKDIVGSNYRNTINIERDSLEFFLLGTKRKTDCKAPRNWMYSGLPRGVPPHGYKNFLLGWS